jgi:hypothetical protein
MREAYNNYKKLNISSSDLNFVGSQRVIRTFHQFQTCEVSQNISLQIIPYVLTGSGERFVGKKAIIKLGKLGDAVT